MKDTELLLIILVAGGVAIGATYYSAIKNKIGSETNPNIVLIDPATTFESYTEIPLKDEPLKPPTNSTGPPQGQDYKNTNFTNGYLLKTIGTSGALIAGDFYVHRLRNNRMVFE